MSAEDKQTQIKTAMLLHVPFFASLLLDVMHVEVTDDTTTWDLLGMEPTCATDGRRIIWYRKFLEQLDLREAVFVTCHEIAHAMWLHMSRGKYYCDMGSFNGLPFYPALWNVAGDFIINDMLVKSNIGSMPKGCLLDPKYTSDMMTDDVYRDLLKQHQQQQQKRGKGGGSGQQQQGPPQPGGAGQKPMDGHIYEQAPLGENEMKRAIATAKEAAKAMGKMPAALERIVEEYLQPKVKWREKLRHCITRAVSREASTWSSPHRRRLVTQKVYLPSYTGFGAGRIVVAFDTSGSVGAEELAQYMGELSDILETCQPEQVIVVSCDAKVYEDSIHYLEAGHDLLNHPPKIVGGGGTAFEPVFEWIENEGIEPACLIYLTDMMGSFPKDAPKYPVIWAATTQSQGPFGETIFIDVKEAA